MKILVLGASGQLGQCLRAVGNKKEFEGLVFPDEKTADILDIAKLRSVFESVLPTFVVNCAAYTAVDKAEEEEEVCREINRIGAKNVALLCKQFGAIMIHVSTDFVFQGDIVKLLTEDDITVPLSMYGLTKLEGEMEILRNIPEHYILRTSWLYSEYGNNFVKTMLKLAVIRDELNVIADQIGTPTYAMDLAEVILNIVGSKQLDFGIYHYSNEGAISWFDFAKSIFEISNIRIKVNPISTSEFPSKALRPKFSVLDKKKIKSTFLLSIPHWRDSLKECIHNITIASNN